MKKLTALTAIAALATAPAFAAIITIEFAPEGADKVVVVLNDETNMMTTDEGETAYTFDPATNTLCDAAGERCATFDGEAEAPVAGASTTYSATNGHTGVATILSVE